jgi:hypothetical protein
VRNLSTSVSLAGEERASAEETFPMPYPTHEYLQLRPRRRPLRRRSRALLLAWTRPHNRHRFRHARVRSGRIPAPVRRLAQRLHPYARRLAAWAHPYARRLADRVGPFLRLASARVQPHLRRFAGRVHPLLRRLTAPIQRQARGVVERLRPPARRGHPLTPRTPRALLVHTGRSLSVKDRQAGPYANIT